MSTFLRTLALTAAAVGAIACVPQDGYYNGGYYNDGYADSGYYDDGYYRQGGYTRIDDRYDRRDRRANRCDRAYNGICDEGRYGGTNRCADGTDTADCRRYASRRYRDRDGSANRCDRAFNGVCDEGRYGGTNRCADGTDTADCTGGWRGRRDWRDDDGWPFD
ncbi:hypothetical protein KXR53_21000 [Inquilinus limosus]|uniref:hypothetical protein n=1 Tax=Inquilinus limosus TaxID=171674 RepID=UPI003F15E845